MNENALDTLKDFDSVIFLTSSNWFTEPRSNRYHYATRFAKHLPVYFVQFDNDVDEVTLEDSDIQSITVVHAYKPIGRRQKSTTDISKKLKNTVESLRKIGGRRPLVWVYNPYVAPLVRAMNPTFVVYHATEIYLFDGSPHPSWDPQAVRSLEKNVKELIQASDLVLAVSDGVHESITRTGLAGGKLFSVKNGVDAGFWIDRQAHIYIPPPDGSGVVLYQGGINSRIDFDLVFDVCTKLPDWQFWFCGDVAPAAVDWQRISALANVRWFGRLSPEDISEKARSALVGWIPFVDAPYLSKSLPLKAFEYVACGLPVVSRRIDELAGKDPILFSMAETPDEFVDSIRRVAASRDRSEDLDLRLQTARANSYDARFSAAVGHIKAIIEARDDRRAILIVYDDKYAFYPALFWHLNAFKNYSRNNVFFLPGSIGDKRPGSDNMFENDKGDDLPDDAYSSWNFEKFDAIVVHYSVRTILDGYIPKFIVEKLSAYTGPKVLFIQDEYNAVNLTISYIKALGITDIFTCVPEEGREYVYPRSLLPGVAFESTLTGYVPEDETFERHALPLRDRKVLIGYRGRQLPHHYGVLGYEKMLIGQVVKKEAEERGLRVDIETDDRKRIYNGWHQFLGSCRATLGTESGSNIFDFDGDLRRRALELAEQPFEEVYGEHFKGYEAPFRMNQISPKFFEAIKLRTALICFPGTYSGILQEGTHYIRLERDFSNIDDVFDKIQNDEFLLEMTDRAYRDIIASGKYSYRAFVGGFDAWLERRTPRSLTEIISVPIAVRRGGRVTPINHLDSRDFILNSSLLGGQFQRQQFKDLFLRQADREKQRDAAQGSLLKQGDALGVSQAKGVRYRKAVVEKVRASLPGSLRRLLRPVYRYLVKLRGRQ